MPWLEGLPEWNEAGAEPPQSKKDTGWEVEEKPPAGWFNWLHHRTFKALEEVQNTIDDIEPAPQGYLYGLTLGWDSATVLTVQPGVARDDGDDLLMILSTAMQKDFNLEWVAGTGNGGLDAAGGLVAEDTLHVYLIGDDDGNVDVIGTMATTDPALPSGYTYKRRIGSVITDNSAEVYEFRQLDDRFWLDTVIRDVDTTDASFDVDVYLTLPQNIPIHGITRYGPSGATDSTDYTWRVSTVYYYPDTDGVDSTLLERITAESDDPNNKPLQALTRIIIIPFPKAKKIRLVHDSAGLPAARKLVYNTVGWIDTRR